ncbi:hypothetical protein C0J52_07282 [Blattella germanica]|nr:hypothetical protein C0J52_07282 [Blattella germanica]
MNGDLEINIIKYNKLNGCIKKHFGRNMRTEIKQRLYNVVSKPALRYGNETWTMRSQDKRRLEAAQMYFMRSLVGKTRRDRVRNQDVRTQKQWKEHVMRMPPCRLPKLAMFYKPDGTRDLGRPRRRWSDQ